MNAGRWTSSTTSGYRSPLSLLVDDFTRQCLVIDVDTSIGGASVSLASFPRLSPLITARSLLAKPSISGLNDPGVTLHHIQPGKPMQNALIESFNGTFRDDCLNQHLV